MLTLHSYSANSLCEFCQHMREVITPKQSRFLLCQLAITEEKYVKYPPQPVTKCSGYEATTDTSSEPDA